MLLCSRCKKASPLPGRRWCLACTSYMRVARAKHRSLPKPPGTCSRTDCSSPASEGRTSCAECRRREEGYESKHRGRVRTNAKATRRRQRMRVFEAYGGACCACCGENHYEFLTIDHINGDGAAHRKQMGSKKDIYFWLEKNSFPPGFRVLCMNCNAALGFHGYCPHHGWTQPTANGRPKGYVQHRVVEDCSHV